MLMRFFCRDDVLCVSVAKDVWQMTAFLLRIVQALSVSVLYKVFMLKFRALIFYKIKFKRLFLQKHYLFVIC